MFLTKPILGSWQLACRHIFNIACLHVTKCNKNVNLISNLSLGFIAMFHRIWITSHMRFCTQTFSDISLKLTQ